MASDAIVRDFRRKIVTAERAVSEIRSGQRVFVGSGAAEPQSLVEALAARGANGSISDAEIVHILTLGIAPYAEPRFSDHFRHNAFFIGPNVRDAVNDCRADYTPVFLSEVPALFRRGQVPLDFALVQVSPPDRYGYCSLGASVDVVKSAAESARHVIAEVNTRAPRTLGDSFLHVRQISAFVESSRPLLELPIPRQDDVAARIGRFIADLIDNGSTLQMGIGAIPNAVLANLMDLSDLGIHTEMLSDGVIPLVEAGVINGSKKTLLPGKIVTSFAMGTRELYDFIDNNPGVEFRPTEFTNDPFNIARNIKMVAINAAIEVDLTGQVCADSLGEYFYSGIGGQVDFIRGAARSPGGKPIIALPSTARLPDGAQVSRITPTLKPGAGVVTTRGDVHYVVTEWGVAYLHGKSIRERALALISIAHPDLREDLLNAAKERRLVATDQPATALAPRYPAELEERAALSDGTAIVVRPIKATDEGLLREFHYQLSQETLYRRYGRAIKALPHSERIKLVNVDYTQDMALVVIRQPDASVEWSEFIGIGRFYLDETTRVAEVAFVVRDDWQEKGIGTLLMRKLIEIARTRNLAGLDAWVSADNPLMVDMLLRFGFQTTARGDWQLHHMCLALAKSPAGPCDTMPCPADSAV